MSVGLLLPSLFHLGVSPKQIAHTTTAAAQVRWWSFGLQPGYAAATEVAAPP